MQLYQEKKLWHSCFPVSIPKFLRTGCSSEMNQRNCFHKIYLQENTGEGVLFSAVADMWAYSFSKIDFITDAFLWKLSSFTEHQFYQDFTEQCCATVSDFLWHFSCITCFIMRYNVSIISVLILVLYYHISIILVLILVLILL